MNKYSTYFKIVPFFILSCIAQRISAQTFTYSSNGSDYYITMSYSGIDAGSFDCSAANDISVYAGTGYNKDEYVHHQYTSGFPVSGSDAFAVGPNKNFAFYSTIIKKGNDHKSGCLECSTVACSGGSTAYHQVNQGNPTVQTDYIHAPINLSYSTTSSGGYNRPVISWQNNSDIPIYNGQFQFDIYRNGILVGSLPSYYTSFTDNTAILSGTYAYTVHASTTTWGTQDASSTGLSVTVTNHVLDATDATLYGKSKLTWPNSAALAVNGISVLKDGTQIAVLNKNAVSYSDFDGVPGVRYNYTVALIDANNNTPTTYSDSGSSRPNGVLSGYVRSVQGTGIGGVTITATGTVDGTPYIYSATTDVSGYYKVKDIYYDTLATYTVVPNKGSDQFDPPSLSRTIDLLNYNNLLADIHDTTVFTVSGKVLYPANGCPVEGAKLYLNNSYTGIKTTGTGSYSFIAPQAGNYTIGFTLGNHAFDSVSRTVYISSNTSGIYFYDTQRDTLVIDLKGGCHNQICKTAAIRVKADPTSATPTCFDTVYHFNGFDPLVLLLPAMKYRVSVDSAYDASGLPDFNITSSLNSIDVDLIKRDTIGLQRIDTITHYKVAYNDTFSNGTIVHHKADTTKTMDTVNTRIVPYRNAGFVYHGTLEIQLTNVDSFCGGLVVEQGSKIPMGIYVHEVSNYNGNITSCLQDTGTLRIYDDVSGAGLNYLPLDHGVVRYTLIPGDPKVPDVSLTHRYQKLFNVFMAAGKQTANLDAWMTITGDRTLTATFVSKTPPMPLMVLHDPPGNSSYSSFEKDSSFSLNITTRANSAFNGGGYINVKVGKTFDVFGITIPGPYFNATFSGTGGFTKDNNQGIITNFTATQTISTSADPQFVGRDADVFIGGTMNTKYAYAFDLSITPSCQVKVDTVLLWGLDSIGSTFVYTGKHIKETLLPQLIQLKKSAKADSSKAYFQNQINLWSQVLKNDSIAIANSNYSNNISFSAGVSYEYTTQQDTTFENTYNYAIVGDINATIGGGISDAQLIDVNAGAIIQFHTEHATDKTSDQQKTTTFTYHFEDNNPGNFYSVNIGKDKNFGSPIFDLFAGTSACPHEKGTQNRDLPTMTITPGAIFNVPPTQPAAFVAQIGNYSESFETRTYTVSVDQSSNLDGAIVKIGGQSINQTPASFTISANATANAALTIDRGPFADDYNNIGIVISSPCDTNVSVYVPISAHFQSACSDVSLLLPVDNWLLNSSNHDTMVIAFTGYNKSNPNLTEIGLQYRAKGSTQTWKNGPAFLATALTGSFQTIAFNIAALPDGNYEVRAYAKCVAPNTTLSYTYSPTLSGVIDRKSFVLFGTPEPSNGILNRSGNISMKFNEPIDCNQLYGRIATSLHRADNGKAVPDTFICSGDQLIITTNPPSLIDSFNNVVLTASVDNVFDANGNGLSNPIQWSFLVNRSQVYWNPSNMHITAVQGTATTGIGTLLNTSGTTQSYTISHTPVWLTPSVLTGSVVSNGSDTIRFHVSTSLNPGTYIDTVIATVNGLQQLLYVSVDVISPRPNWSVNPSAYAYNMNITSNYSLTSANAPLSKDTRDIIAAFKGDECRGLGTITYDPITNNYIAYLTAYSNSLVGDTLTFRMWDAVPGTEYQAVERLVFISDGNIGQPAAPYILHPEGQFQTIALNNGWNWFSLNAKTNDMSVAKVLSHLHPNAGATVKTINAYSQYSTSAGWQGTLTNFGIDKSYMIQLDHADTIHWLGKAVTENTNLTVAPGWNWIGYSHQGISADTAYLNHFNAGSGDILKSQTQFTQYNGGNWAGSIHYLYPGQGYKLRSTNGFNVVVSPDRSQPTWIVDENKYQQNMSITADLQFNSVSTSQSHYVVGAFDNNTCIGTAQPLYIPALGIYRVFLTVHGDTAIQTHAISFKVFDTDNSTELVPSYSPISVIPDTSVATVAMPFILNIATTTGINALHYNEGYRLLQNVPNPFSSSTYIEYETPATQSVTITLYDESGRLVRELVHGPQNSGVHRIVVDADNLQSGVYFYQMKSAEYSQTRRLMILR